MDERLFSKKGKITLNICTFILNTQIGEKLPSIDFFAKKYQVGRGTIQTVLNNLIDDKIIIIKKSGRNGTILEDKNISKLLKLINKNNLLGSMPLPYTKRYEGLATGLVMSLKKSCKVNVNMSYIKSSLERIRLLNDERIDFAVVSGYHAHKIINDNSNLEILTTLDDYTYVSKHVIIKNQITIKKVGIDANSYVHSKLIEENFRDVIFVHVDYSNLNRALIKKEIDATIINFDDFCESNFETIFINEDINMTRASIIINKKNIFLKTLVESNSFNLEVFNIQRKILLDEIDPRF